MMAISKKKKTTKAPRPGSGNFWSNLGTGAAVLLALAGQFLFLKGSQALGMFLTVAGLGLLAAIVLGWLDLSKISFLISLPKSPVKPKVKIRPAASFPRRGSSGKSSRGVVPTFETFKGITPLGIFRTFLVLAAIYLGSKGQAALADMGRADTVGLWYYFVGVILFLAALWPWKREGLKLLPLAPKVEWALFGAVMVLAAFLRLYKLDTIPSGIFFDMGFQGYGALKILHERWFPWELNITENFPSAPVPIYFGALWFMFFKNTQFNLNLFYVTMSLASFPLIYWTFRQLAGPRVALLSLYILAVMRWNLNFSRNSFPPSLLPFFMFATLGCLLYGLRTKKLWPFVTAGVLFPVGLYAYQTYVMFTVVVFLCALYECVNNWQAVKANAKHLAVFSAIFLVLSGPFFKAMLTGESSTRIKQLSIFNRCKEQHSIQPLLVNLKYTALMYNLRGDPNPRHNLQDHRQLDDVTGFLLLFGVFYALARGWRRKYFYGLVGFFVMAVPCLITIDPAHSSRMYCQTAFVAFLSACVVSALWSRARSLGGQKGEILFLLFLVPPMGLMLKQNFHTYFVEQANNYASWAEFSIAESTIGRKFADYGDKYDCYVSPRYYSHYTIDYLDYFFLDKVKRMDLPETLAALPAPGRGLLYAMEQGRTGVLDTLRSYFPGGEAEIDKDPNGGGFLYFYRVPPEIVDKARGLKAEFSDGKEGQAAQFPEVLPPGPYHATFTGDIFITLSGEYHFNFPKKMSWTIGGESVREGVGVKLAKGFHPVKIHWTQPEGNSGLAITFDGPSGKKSLLGGSNFMTIPSTLGLKGQYYGSLDFTGVPFLEQWEPVLNFVNGNDFPVQGGAMGVHWSGTLNAPESGNYRFSTRTSGTGGLKIDRHTAIPDGKPQGEVHLTKGPHSIDVYYAKPNGWGADFTFLWIKPGDMSFDVVPNSAFGEVR